MKITLRASALVSAFSLVSCVTPKPLTPNGVGGYLLKVEGASLSVYSRDTQTLSKAVVPLEGEVEEGLLLYPSQNVSALKFLGDQEITLTGYKEEDSYLLSYTTESGVVSKKVTTDPDLFILPEAEIDEAEAADEFPAGVLHHILQAARPFVADPKDTRAEEHFKTVQLFGTEGGSGYTFSATGSTSCSAFCESFQGKTLSVHGQHLSSLIDFLGKVTGTVKVKHSSTMELVEAEDGSVFGFARTFKNHPSFRIYGTDKDEYVFRVPKKLFADMIGYAKAEMDPSETRVRLQYTRNANNRPTIRLCFDGSKSQMETFSVGVAPQEENGQVKIGSQDWSLGINPDSLSKLIHGVSHEVELRVNLVTQRGKTLGMIRTREEYRVDDTGKVSSQGHQCKIFRWAASKELLVSINDLPPLRQVTWIVSASLRR